MQFKNKPSRIREDEAFFGSWKGDRGRLKFFKGLKVGGVQVNGTLCLKFFGGTCPPAQHELVS